MLLTMTEMGKKNSIKQINGKDSVKKFLESLGFTVGSDVTVISELGGNMIVSVKDSRVAIDKGMANRIIV